MAFNGFRSSVVSTATLVVTAAGKTLVRISGPVSGSTVFFGPDNSVTTSSGISLGFSGPLLAEGLTLQDGQELWGIVASGTSVIEVITEN